MSESKNTRIISIAAIFVCLISLSVAVILAYVLLRGDSSINNNKILCNSDGQTLIKDKCGNTFYFVLFFSFGRCFLNISEMFLFLQCKLGT
jgi:hypothetical protein